MSGVFVLSVGAVIKFIGWTWLLAGYSKLSSPVPDDVVQDIAGNTILRIEIGVFVFGVFISVTDPPPYLELVVGIVMLVAVARLLYRLNIWSPSRKT